MSPRPFPDTGPGRDGKLGTVLIADDDTLASRLVAHCLGRLFHIVIATDGRSALAAVAASQPDLVMLDVCMPDMDGYQVCAALKGDEKTRHIPIIFLSGSSDLPSEARGLELGAVDYLVKPFTPQLLLGRVKNHVEQKLSRDRLAIIAMVDGLTGIANRRRFDGALRDELRRMTRTQEDMALLMMDIDHFKLFNDTYGHPAGDDCLRRIARAIAGCMDRPFDLVARYGGEEFACLLPATGLDGAERVAQRILDAVAALAIPHAASSTGRVVSLSIGVACSPCSSLASPDVLIDMADGQLYRAKQAGRARICATAAPPLDREHMGPGSEGSDDTGLADTVPGEDAREESESPPPATAGPVAAVAPVAVGVPAGAAAIAAATIAGPTNAGPITGPVTAPVAGPVTGPVATRTQPPRARPKWEEALDALRSLGLPGA